MLRASLARPGVTLLGLVCVTAGCAASVATLRVDHGASIWLPHDHELRQERRAFAEWFDAEETVAAWLGPLALDEPAVQDDLRALDASVREAVAPQPVWGPFDEAGALTTAPYVDRGVGRALWEVGVPAAGAARAETLEALERVFADRPEASLAGIPVLDVALDQEVWRALRSTLPLAWVAVAFALVIGLRDLQLVVAVAGASVAAGTGALGLVGFTDRPLNLWVAVVPVVVGVLTAASGAHVAVRFARTPNKEGENEGEGELPEALRAQAAWLRAARRVATPTALTALTTSTGFAALVVSGVPAVRDLGWACAVGVWGGALWALIGVPALGIVLGARPQPQRWWTAASLGRWTAGWARGRGPALWAGTALGVVALVGLGRLHVANTLTGALPPGHPAVHAASAATQAGLGVAGLDVWIEGPRSEVGGGPALRTLEAVVASGADREGCVGVRRGWSAEQDLDAVAQRLWEAPSRWVRARDDDGAVCVRLGFDPLEVEALTTAAARVRRAVAEASWPEGVRAHVGGGGAAWAVGQTRLVQAQLRSFGVAWVLVALILWAALRAPGLTLTSVWANVLPVGVTLGLMGWWGVPLDGVTVTVIAVAFGLVVDDTIHLLHEYQRARRQGLSAAAGTIQTLTATGHAVSATSLAVVLGFGALALSPFPPVRAFGAAMAVTAAVAWVADMILLPAWLVGGADPGKPAPAPSSQADAS